MRRKMRSDALSIVKRVKAIDDKYELYYDDIKCKYELHHMGQGKDTFCLCIPYDRLDSRTIVYIHKTSIRYFENNISDMDEHNKRLEIANENEIKDIASHQFLDIYRYLSRGDREINNIYLNKWI